MAGQEIVSTEPATGAVLWRNMPGDVDEEVATARANWASWAAQPLAYRLEALRRFVNVVRTKADAFTDLIARETGKPLWEARTEIDTVIGKVNISATAYAERTPQRRLDSQLSGRLALRHKPHGVLAVLGPYNFPAHLPNGHIVPALLAGNAVVFKPSEKTPATGAFLVDCFHEAGVPKGVLRLLIGGPAEGKALAAEENAPAPAPLAEVGGNVAREERATAATRAHVLAELTQGIAGEKRLWRMLLGGIGCVCVRVCAFVLGHDMHVCL